MAGTRVKTMVSPLKYVYIKGEGRNQALKGDDPRMQYVASVIMKENGVEHKALLALIDEEWEAYKAEHGVKGRPKTNGIKPQLTKDPEGTIDPETEEVAKIPTGNVIATFKTNTKWPDGNPQVVAVKDRKGKDITAAVTEAAWSIGDGSLGIIHGTAVGNNIGGTQKVTLYLSAVQLAKLVKYEGNEVECDEIEGEDIDLDDGVEAIESSDTAPKL